jgi:4-amino-4-deoxy-L-arabinose transferase-like glycosyltransferase
VAGSEARGEAHQPPLYYILLAAAGETFRLTPIPLEPARNASFLWYGGSDENKYHHAVNELPPLSGSLRSVHGLRLISVLLSGVTVLVIHRLAASMLPPAEALLAAGLAAFLPQFTFIAASVNNDNLANALCSAAILLLVLAMEAPRPILWAGAGALTGMALTAKFTSLVLVPCALLSVGLATHACRERRIPFAPLRAGLAFLAPALLIASPLLIRNAIAMGDPLGMGAQVATLPNLLDRKGPLAAYFLLEFPVVLFESFWGRFGWMSLRLPDGLYLALTLPAAGAAIGLMLAGRQPSRRQMLLAAIVGLQVAQFLAYNLTFTQAQGRFLFPALGPIAVLMCTGWGALGRRWGIPAPGPGAALIAVSLMALANLAVLFGIVAPAYGR